MSTKVLNQLARLGYDTVSSVTLKDIYNNCKNNLINAGITIRGLIYDITDNSVIMTVNSSRDGYYYPTNAVLNNEVTPVRSEDSRLFVEILNSISPKVDTNLSYTYYTDGKKKLVCQIPSKDQMYVLNLTPDGENYKIGLETAKKVSINASDYAAEGMKYLQARNLFTEYATKLLRNVLR